MPCTRFEIVIPATDYLPVGDCVAIAVEIVPMAIDRLPAILMVASPTIGRIEPAIIIIIPTIAIVSLRPVLQRHSRVMALIHQHVAGL